MTPDARRSIERNAASVRARIEAACADAGRDSGGVTLVAVTKYVSPAVIASLADAGIADVGESRPERLVEVRAALGERAGAFRWHQVGTVQRRKVRSLVGQMDVLHSLDRRHLLDELAKHLPADGPSVEAFVQVNISGEEAKSGVRPAEARGLVERAAECPGLQVVGLMTMAPARGDPTPVFRGLRELRNEIARDTGLSLPSLSMGMSDDFETAIREGATHVRIGSALFEGIEA